MVLFKSLCLLATAATSVVAQVDSPNVGYCFGTDYPCTNGVFVLGARGIDDDSNNTFIPSPNYQNLQGMEDIAIAVNKKAGGYCRAIPYPASGSLAFGMMSIDEGVTNGQKIVKDYVDKCGAGSKIMLLGYSAGATVITEMLIGSPPLHASLSGKYASAMTGAAIFGSPGFRHGYAPLDAGNATTDGVLATDPLTYSLFNLNWGRKVRNYCQFFDASCADGGLNDTAIAIHLAAVQVYKNDASNFLAGLV